VGQSLTSESSGRVRLASPTTALILGTVWLLIAIAIVPTAYFAHQLDFSDLGGAIGVFAPFGLVGVVIAYRQPRNAIGWILLATGIGLLLSGEAGSYAVMRYRLGYHSLPLGRLAVALTPGWSGLIVLLPLTLVLFPDGRLPSRRWRWVLRAYFAIAAVFLATVVWQDAPAFFDRHIQIDSNGELMAFDQSGGRVNAVQGVLLFPYLAFCALSVVRLVLGFRRSTGTEHQQWKWLLSGGAVGIGGLVGALELGSVSGVVGAVASAGFLAVVALPISMGVAILRYRLYEIDRLVSRTLSYAILTGLLVAIYFGVVTLTTRALPLSSPVGVAASTLAAAALFNPLRGRIQHVVDHRFNRARYDAEAVTDAFTRTLRDAIELDTVSGGLAEVVDRTVRPAHVSLWIRPTERGRVGGLG
jgi:hypothetical protein